MKKIISAFLCLAISCGFMMITPKANSTKEVQPRTHYDWSTNPNGSEYDIFELKANATRKVVGPWNGGFRIGDAWGQFEHTWRVSASGSHWSNVTLIEMTHGDTGEVLESHIGYGSIWDVAFTKIPTDSAGINFYVTNMTNEWQAFWSINVKNCGFGA